MGDPFVVDGFAFLEADGLGVYGGVVDVAIDEGLGDAQGAYGHEVLAVAIHACFFAHFAGGAWAGGFAAYEGAAGVFPLVGADEFFGAALGHKDAL